MQNTISAEEFDRRFDAGEDISEHVDWENAQRVNKTRRVNVDFPAWMVKAMDREAGRIGITRQALIKVVMAERLDKNV